MSKTRKLNVTCPCCDADLVVDVATSKVLSHREANRPAAAGKDFDSLLAGLDADRERAEEVFAQEVAALEDRERLLEEKFKHALERAKESPEDEPPPSPFDLE